MADLIELDLVVRDKGLKASVSTVERLERQIIKAQKAVDQNTISQARYNKILLAAKRDYQALGMSSQKATAQVRAFAAANKQAQVATVAQTGALNSATVATNKLSAAQHQTKNKMNGNNMAIQQLGYQFGDFAVQVQGGTSAFVAFSQQGAQLAGILPMIAGPLGLSMGAAVGLSAALGILIPIGSAVARMFFEMKDATEGANKKVKTFEESLISSQSAITAVDSAIQDLSDKSLDDLRERYGQVTTQVLELEKALKRIETKALTEEVQGAMNTLFTPEFFSQIESSFGAIGSAIVETTEEDLVDMRREIQLIQQLLDQGMFVSELDRQNLKEMNEELAAATGNFAKMGSLVDELSVSQEVLNTYRELERRIKEATKAGNFTVAADGISSMRKLFEDLGIEVENGALANMTRLEEVLRDANGTLGKGTVLSMTISKAFAVAADKAERLFSGVSKGLSRNLELTKLQIDVVNAVAGAEDRLGKLKGTYARADFISKQTTLGLSGEELTNVLNIYDALVDQTTALEYAEEKAKKLADAFKEAATAMSNLTKFGDTIEKSIVKATAEIKALKEGGDSANASMIASLKFELGLRHEIALATAVGSDARQAASDAYEASLKRIVVLEGLLKEKFDLKPKSSSVSEEERKLKGLRAQAKAMNLAANATAKYKDEYDKLLKLRGNGLTEEAFANEVAKLNEELANSSPVLQGFTDAFSDFLGRGANDFKAFANDILDMFKNMIVKMIAIAARNRIMLSMGMGGGTLGTAAQAGQLAGVGSPAGGGMMGSMIGGFAGGGAAGTGILGGAASAFSGFASGGMAGGFSAIGTALGGATTGMAGFGMALGAVAGPLLAVVAVISFFKKKVKELDSGLQGTVTTLDATIESFSKIQTSRFFGLSKKVSTSGKELSEEAAAPFVKAIQDIQMSVMDAASEFGIAGDVFDNFSYDFKLSLKGLSEEAKSAAIAEEFTKMGDAFAEMTGHFETMAEAIEAANQRMGLRNRLDQLLGNNAAILARHREAELKGMHELNKSLAQMIYNLEDAQSAFVQADLAVGNAFKALRVAIDAEKQGITDSFTSLLEGLRTRLDAANEVMKRTQTIVNMLEGALSGRSVTRGLDQKFARREQALGFLKEGNFEDEKMLKEALSVVSEPTEGLFGTFVEYAREFGRTSLILDQSKKIAEVQLSADEAAVVLLESQIEQAAVNHDAQLEALDAQYAQQEAAYAALLGIDTSVKSVGDAIAELSTAIQAALAAQLAAQEAAAAASAAAAAAAVTAAADTVVVTGTSDTVLSSIKTSVSAATDLANEAFDKGYTSNDMMAETIARAESNRDSGGSSSSSSSFSSAVSSGWEKVKSAFGFATGGSHTGGLRMVGERGPELEATGPSRIFSSKQTSKMFSNPELVEEIRGLRSEVSGLRSEQRQMQASSTKYVKRNYDINRKWDVDGLPATRT